MKTGSYSLVKALILTEAPEGGMKKKTPKSKWKSIDCFASGNLHIFLEINLFKESLQINREHLMQYLFRGILTFK